MDITDAFKIVTELASQNLAPEDMPEERKRQIIAISLIEGLGANEKTRYSHKQLRRRPNGKYEISGYTYYHRKSDGSSAHPVILGVYRTSLKAVILHPTVHIPRGTCSWWMMLIINILKLR